LTGGGYGMSRTRSAGYGDQRDLIRARAAELFATQGYAATSMNEVAKACGLSKPAVYHYFADKESLLLDIADGHVSRLLSMVEAVTAAAVPGDDARQLLHVLIERLVAEYAGAQHAHRVLTEDVRFLPPADRERVLDKQRLVVDAFARQVARLRPDAEPAGLVKPLTMLLFGMVNWMFTWHRPDGAISHQAMAPLVADVFAIGLAGAAWPPSLAPTQPPALAPKAPA
jgi:AcrR family transcriptional regulator